MRGQSRARGRSAADKSMAASLPSNFGFLQVHDAQRVRFGLLAEKYFPDDPDTCLLKLRQFGEVLAQLVASRAGPASQIQDT